MHRICAHHKCFQTFPQVSSMLFTDLLSSIIMENMTGIDFVLITVLVNMTGVTHELSHMLTK